MPANPPAPVLWIFLSAGIAASVILGIVAVIFAHGVHDIRCYNAHGSLVVPVQVLDGGISAGKIVFSSVSVQSQIRWWLGGNYSGSVPSRISYRGPMNQSMIAPYALTLCGGNTTQTCQLLEMGTCHKRNLPPNCRLLETVSFNLDSSDTALEEMNFFNITSFVSLAKTSPHLFYLSVEVDGEEVQRGLNLGGVCTRDHI